LTDISPEHLLECELEGVHLDWGYLEVASLGREGLPQWTVIGVVRHVLCIQG
jgi:hypothetical protein